jgi:hypothetical protein
MAVMRLMFIYWAFQDQGSGVDIRGYSEAARASGHEVVLYGRPDPAIPLTCSLDVESADALVFVFEWTTALLGGDALDLARLVGRVPRSRRIVIDCDGAYNDAIEVGGDYNHRDAAAARRWVEVCDSLSDTICQPTLRPRRPNVRPFLFHGYDPAWEQPLDFGGKEYGMVYVGHSKFRWRPMHRVLEAVAPIRERVGRIGVVGHGWDALPRWAKPMQLEDAFYVDYACLGRLGIEHIAPVPFEQVIHWMSKGVFSPVLYRPLFSHLGLVTCRTFETPAAGTIPLFGLDPGYVREIYGKEAVELILGEGATDKLSEMLGRPERYAEVVRGIRRHLAERHSYAARLRELIAIVDETATYSRQRDIQSVAA